jgi:hypothetical protein
MAYHLEGRVLEVCDCKTLCPCWIGEEPDNGICLSTTAYHFDKGAVDGVDVAGRTLALQLRIPGKAAEGNYHCAIYIDDGASQAQMDAVVNAFTGKLGGPMADVAKLIGKIVSIERAAITFDVVGCRGTLKVGEAAYAEVEPFKGPDGSPTTLSNTSFSNVPGQAIFVGKATQYRSKNPAVGHDLNLTGHNALQSKFVFDS